MLREVNQLRTGGSVRIVGFVILKKSRKMTTIDWNKSDILGGIDYLIYEAGKVLFCKATIYLLDQKRKEVSYEK